jgi:hypothetical protein
MTFNLGNLISRFMVKKIPLTFYDFLSLFFMIIIQCYMIALIFASQFFNFRLLLDEKEALLLWLLFVFSMLTSLVLFTRTEQWFRFSLLSVLIIELVMLLTAIIERLTW